ncbi:unnamed protein product [Oikopleura dioica]|uniref:Uncharacterized protein n=1 Tax=Oikopleura dioica TaxID=34765 RepID=E4XEG8_OIKDI|nr:unnamed protein product [Oikopleura dioica]
MSAEGFFFRSPPKEEKTFSKRISSNSKSSPDADLTHVEEFFRHLKMLSEDESWKRGPPRSTKNRRIVLSPLF